MRTYRILFEELFACQLLVLRHVENLKTVNINAENDQYWCWKLIRFSLADLDSDDESSTLFKFVSFN